MIATLQGGVYLVETSDIESMVWGVYVNESMALVTTVFVIHPFV